jgi:hypothetical protein
MSILFAIGDPEPEDFEPHLCGRELTSTVVIFASLLVVGRFH